MIGLRLLPFRRGPMARALTRFETSRPGWKWAGRPDQDGHLVAIYPADWWPGRPGIHGGRGATAAMALEAALDAADRADADQATLQ